MTVPELRRKVSSSDLSGRVFKSNNKLLADRFVIFFQFIRMNKKRKFAEEFKWFFGVGIDKDESVEIEVYSKFRI